MNRSPEGIHSQAVIPQQFRVSEITELNPLVSTTSLPEFGASDFIAGGGRAGTYQTDRKLPTRQGSTALVVGARSQDNGLVTVKIGLSSNPQAVNHFMREAEIHEQVASVTPHVPEFIGEGNPTILLRYGEAPDAIRVASYPAIAMEHIRGRSLAEVAKSNRVLGVGRTLLHLGPVAEALDGMHDKAGILHTDVKPANIMLRNGMGGVLLDFGIAQPMSYKTIKYLQGSPGYMAPEMALAEPIDATVDVYGLGMTALASSTGRSPLDGYNSYLDYLKVQLSDEYVPHIERLMAGTDLTTAEADVLLSAVAVDPSDRPQSAGEFYGRFKEAHGVTKGIFDLGTKPRRDPPSRTDVETSDQFYKTQPVSVGV